ncbi:ankyrin repeat-containing protein BDA1-like [Vitis riparia]|uniref:ankyrin repeat-containing protein BDA1-like n=1 Tax=Vitis riparia TaxID=96939 RepID=UPI00155AF5B1|nr:ankyrin repeat-containing protein BDA1-like [Vitis riparia]
MERYEKIAKDEESVEGRERRLYEASVTGSVNSLKRLIAKDPLTLARAAVTCFNETPLHVAAMLGHLDFASYLLTHKPDMTRALDLRGRSPLHLASANGYVEMVNILLSSNPDACLIRDEDGRTPLHLAVMKGEVEVTRMLVGARPQVTRYKLDQGETILHSAVKQNRLGALKLLVELAGEVEFVNSKDDYGNTVLHTATALKQFETAKYLVERPEMEVNAVNGNGFTALDIIQHTPRDLKGMEIRESLVKAGALSSRNIPALLGKGHQLMGESGITMVIENPQLSPPPPPAVAVPTEAKTSTPLRGREKKIHENKKEWTMKKREALMVAATLIAGMAFQAAINPPGGVWGEEKDDGNGKKMLAGTSIMAHNYPGRYRLFMACNAVSFVTSLSIVFLVVSGVPFVKRRILMWPLMIIMWITLTFMAFTYMFSILAIAPTNDDTEAARSLGQVIDINYVVGVSLLVWFSLFAFVVLVHIIRFLIWCVRKVGKAIIYCFMIR